MKPDFAQLGFTIEETFDGSPTLKLAEGAEIMHHSGGAASETNYIYTEPMRAALALMPEASTCVVGLGLGYIEIAWALCNPVEGASLVSYEIEPPLRESFKAWCLGEADSLYDRITNCLHPGADAKAVRTRLAANLLQNEIRNDIRAESVDRWNVICFDAFSKKSAADLWEEEFLSKFIKNACAPDCIFTTYAFTGSLKRSLQKNGFIMLDRRSFNGKRDSALAVRGLFTSVSVSRIF